ncbi:MAG: tripartite tricarboxylate transporter substrate binding protein, partial [Methyloceanibacter sp.]
MRPALTTALLAASALALAAGPAFSQTFPAKPITLICPWPAGGSTDTHLRKFAEIAAKNLGKPVVIENKPGASGMLG